MIWDIDFVKRLQHAGSRFELEISFQSDVQRLVLFGPSGAGKTQTLKVIAGLVRGDRGHVRVANKTLFSSKDGIHLSPQQRRMAYVFQDYALFPHLTVCQNIAFARRSGWINPPRRRVDTAVDRWIETFHLTSVANHYPHQISGGQRQRTAIARALMNEPAALLLDEPFAALDKGLRHRLRDDLARLQRELQIPMLMITHDDDDVGALADAGVNVHAGRSVPASDACAPTGA